MVDGRLASADPDGGVDSAADDSLWVGHSPLLLATGARADLAPHDLVAREAIRAQHADGETLRAQVLAGVDLLRLGHGAADREGLCRGQPGPAAPVGRQVGGSAEVPARDRGSSDP